MLTCETCNKTFAHAGHYNMHRASAACQRKRKMNDAPPVVKKSRLNAPPQAGDFSVRLVHRGLKNMFKIYRASFNGTFSDIVVITSMLLDNVVYLLNGAVVDMDGIKAHLRLVWLLESWVICRGGLSWVDL